MADVDSGGAIQYILHLNLLIHPIHPIVCVIKVPQNLERINLFWNKFFEVNHTTARRTLRLGKEFSSFDMAVGHAIALSPPHFFDVAECLSQRIQDQEASQMVDEPQEPHLPDDPLEPPLPFWINPLPASSPLPPPLPSRPRVSTGPPTDMDYKKGGSHRRRDRKRKIVQEENGTPGVKAISIKRRNEALGGAIQVDVDIDDLPHSKPSWIGKRNAEEDHSFEDGMGGRIYTSEEIKVLTGEDGMRYINWLGVLSIPIIDSYGRIIAVLGGTPRDTAGWRVITDRAAKLMEEKASRLRHSDEQLHHRRAHEPYPSVSRGISHGGGQTEPGELQNNMSNMVVTDELLAYVHFNLTPLPPVLFSLFAPLLFLYYQTGMADLKAWNPSMVWNTVFTVFAACTFNFGPHAITVPHLDFGNLAWGWCVITALGRFNPDLGGHLILWDLKLVIRFPPGSTILIPSAIIRHSNVPIAAEEFRCSFTQYTAGGLFRFIRNGFKTDHVFEMTATREEKESRNREAKTRWEQGVAMYSTVDSLRK
ncbi:hypothetical protein C8R46DRAFT_1214647 [Mycena filopes]|nr:hypothetical protein C8R46DRAFT_1214647 [Mycena filopes]